MPADRGVMGSLHRSDLLYRPPMEGEETTETDGLSQQANNFVTISSWCRDTSTSAPGRGAPCNRRLDAHPWETVTPQRARDL
jgi:hypothetical protein